MSKDKVLTTVKDDLNAVFHECIKNIENTIKITVTGDLQDILLAILNQSYYKMEYKPFKRDIFDINTLLTSDPLTVIGYVKDCRFTAKEIKEFQKEGQELISKLANSLENDEQELLKKIVGPFQHLLLLTNPRSKTF